MAELAGIKWSALITAIAFWGFAGGGKSEVWSAALFTCGTIMFGVACVVTALLKMGEKS